MRLNIINALMLKYWYMGIRSIDRLLDVFYWPLIGMLIWGFTTYYLSNLVKDSFIISVLLGGAILWTFFSRAQGDIGIYILEDFWSRNLTNLFASPMTNFELIASTAIFGFFRSIISFLFLIAVAYFMYSFNILAIGAVYVAVFAIGLMLFGWVIGIFVTALIFRYGTRFQMFAWTIPWLIQPFSAVFYPLNSLPIWLQKISLLIPTTYLFEGMRTTLMNNALDWKSIAFSFVLNIFLFFVVYIFFERSMYIAKKKGMLTKY